MKGYGPYTELRVVRDRLIGAVLGSCMAVSRWIFSINYGKSHGLASAVPISGAAVLTTIPLAWMSKSGFKTL